VKKLPARSVIQLGIAVLLQSGCFTYMPAELRTLPEGGQVRVHLTRQGVAALPEVIDQNGPRLAGTLVWRNDDQLLLRVPDAANNLNRPLAQQVVITATDIVRFESRKLNATRTALVVGGGLAIAAALYAGFETGKPANPEKPEEPEVEGMVVGFRRIQLFSLQVW
jgi:hypothetical protein